MKKRILFVFCSFIFFVSGQFNNGCNLQPIISSEEGVCNYDPYILVFEDNFDGNDIDFSKWKLPYQGVMRDYGFSSEKEWYANDNSLPYIPYQNNLIVENGLLKIIAKKENPPVVGTYYNWDTNPGYNEVSTFNYSSGELDSKYKFDYGQFEIRCKIPKGKGFWPAFWTFGGPGWNEIDVFEFWNEWSGPQNNKQFDPSKLSKVHKMNFIHEFLGVFNACPTSYEGVDFSQNFHTFKAKWTPYTIEYYVDGVFVRQDYRYFTLLGQIIGCNGLHINGKYSMNKAFPIEPMNIIANLAIQNNGGNNPDASTPFPSTFEIDYIRYWKQLDCPSNLNITDNAQLNLSSEVYNTIVGDHLSLGNNVQLNANQQLAVIASTDIVLGPGTTIDGTNFTTEIRPNICTLHQLVADEPPVTAIYGQADGNDEHLSVSKNISVMPNPFDDKIQIVTNFFPSEHEFIEVQDLLGKQIFEYKFENENHFEIDLSNLHSGLYLLNFYDAENKMIETHKIIKK